MGKILNGRKGISAVVTTLIMIALVVALTAVVWSVVNNLVISNIGSAKSCFGVTNKVFLDKQNTCYDGSRNQVNFSIGLKDIGVEEVLISISGSEATKSFTINYTLQNIPGVKNYGDPDFTNRQVSLPEKNAGKTYAFQWNTAKANRIEIAPIIDGNQCESSDFAEIEFC